MGRYVFRRVVGMVPVLLIMSLMIFFILRVLPGDPISAFIGQDAAGSTPEQRAALAEELGLDRSVLTQYRIWLGDLLQGDWGRSLISRQPVGALVGARLQITVQFAFLAWCLAVMLGIPLGIVSALRRNSWLDVGVNFGALAGLATPNFVLGLGMIIIFAVYLKVLPTNGYVPLTTNPGEAIRHMIMPIIALSTGELASLTRQTRSAMLEVMNEDYIRTARAKGLSNRRVLLGHALKNAMLPVVTVSGLQLGRLASGAIIVESMFSIPGMGRLTIDAIRQHDFNTIQIVVLTAAIFTMVANLLADLAYVVLDPRIRLA